MKNYSVMPMFMEHIDEYVEDIKLQYKKGIAVCPMFIAVVHPEGIPVIDKVTGICEKFIAFKEKLDKENIPSGFLVQSTIGHGYALNNPMPFTPYTPLSNSGETATAYCPLDDDYRTYIKDCFRKLAECRPAALMIDDDVTVMHYRPGIGGCVCDKHMAEFNKRAGTNMTREELFDYILSHPNDDKITLTYVELQKDALVGAVKAMRAGIDEVDPTIQGIICTTGDICEFAKDLAPAFAGKGNPTIARIGCGAYAPSSSHEISGTLYRVKARGAALKGHIDYILAEGDTIPMSRYGRNKAYYHTQMTMFTLHGCTGAKLWITDTSSPMLKAGKIFRDVLGGNMPFYDELIRISGDIEWIGCNQPYQCSEIFDFTGYADGSNWFWSMKCLERLGLPICFKNGGDKASFISGKSVKGWSDEFINGVFEKGDVYLSSDCLENLTERGFTDKIGVIAREWKGKPLSGETYNGTTLRKQYKQKELVPVNDKVYADSIVFHLENNKDRVPLFPAVSVFPREDGKKTVVFSGTPDAPFNYSVGFGLLNALRKEQLINLLKPSGTLPVYYTEDAEIFLNAGYMGKDKMVLAPFNLGWDVLDEFPIFCEHDIKKIEKINADGTYSEVEFTKDGNNYVIKQELGSLIPQVFILHI